MKLIMLSSFSHYMNKVGRNREIMEERKSCRPSFLVPMYLIKGRIIEKTELWIRTNAEQL